MIYSSFKGMKLSKLGFGCMRFASDPATDEIDQAKVNVVGLSYESSVVALINDGAPIECVYMEEGNTAMAGGAAIIKTAPNLPAAQAMMDLLSSAEFQDARAQASAGRGSNSNCNLQGLPEESGLGIVDLDFNYLAEHKDKLIDRFTEMYANLSE